MESATSANAPAKTFEVTPETHTHIKQIQNEYGFQSIEAVANTFLFLARTNPGLVAQAADLARRFNFTSAKDMAKKGF